MEQQPAALAQSTIIGSRFSSSSSSSSSSSGSSNNNTGNHAPEEPTSDIVVANQSRYGRKRKRVQYNEENDEDNNNGHGSKKQHLRKITSRDIVFVVDENELKSIPFGVRFWCCSCYYNCPFYSLIDLDILLFSFF